MDNNIQFEKQDDLKRVQGWNWGAFMHSILWGFGNKSYLPLICLIPFVNLIWVFVCGFKGNEWAWNKTDKDIETFLAIQETWNRAGFVTFIFAIVALVLYALIAISVFV